MCEVQNGRQQQHELPGVDVEAIRCQLANRGLVFFAALAPIALTFSLIRILEHGWHPLYLLHALATGLVITAAVCRKRLAYRARVCVLLGLVFVVGAAGVFSFGLLDGGPLVLVAFVFLTTVVFGSRAGLVACAAGLAVIAVVGVAVCSGTIVYSFDITEYTTSATAWVVMAIVFFMWVPVTVIAIGVVQDHLVASLRDLASAKKAADAAANAKTEFLANMSHEIRTPMTAILGYSEVLSEELADQEQRNTVATIRQNGEYLLKVLNDILDLSKIEAGRLEVEEVRCSPMPNSHRSNIVDANSSQRKEPAAGGRVRRLNSRANSVGPHTTSADSHQSCRQRDQVH